MQWRRPKRGPSNEIGYSRGGVSSQIYVAVDVYDYPVCLMFNKQRNDIILLVRYWSKLIIERSSVLAARGYDSQKLIDYIYDKLAFTDMGFACLASILIWIKWSRNGNFQSLFYGTDKVLWYFWFRRKCHDKHRIVYQPYRPAFRWRNFIFIKYHYTYDCPRYHNGNAGLLSLRLTFHYLLWA